MPRYVKLYPDDPRLFFKGFVEGYESSDTLVVGRSDATAILARIDPRGRLVWLKRYRFGEGTISFTHGVGSPGDDALIYGRLKAGSENYHLVVRVDSGGEVVWSRAYRTPHTRFARRLVRAQGDRYFFTGWHNVQSSVDSVELAKIDGAGNLLQTRVFGTSGDDQVEVLLPHGNGCVVVGETSAGPGWDGFVAAFNADLSLSWTRRLGGPGFDAVQAAAPIGAGQFMLAGVTTQQGAAMASSSFVVRFSRLAATARGQVFDLFPGASDSGSKRLLRSSGGGWYFLAHPTGGSGDTLVSKVRITGGIDWTRRFHLDHGYRLFDLAIAGAVPGEILLCGRQVEPGGALAALLARTDLELESCRTLEESTPQIERLSFPISEWTAGLDSVEMLVADPGIWCEATPARSVAVCRPLTTIVVGEHTRVQSPNLYLQAVGSDTTDHSSRGVHLRWTLTGDLGERHLPKGQLAAPGGPYPSTLELDGSDDFVRIYRTEFDRKSPARLDFREPPVELLETGPAREWRYLYQHPAPLAGTQTTVLVRFSDVDRYDSLRATIEPLEQPASFVALYGGVLEVTCVDKAVFKVDLLGFAPQGPGARLRLETIAIPATDSLAERLVTCRRELAAADLPDHTLVSENIETLRLMVRELAFGVIELHTYIDTLGVIHAGGDAWTELGEFSLSLDDAEVFARLENGGVADVDGSWPRFNEPDLNSGAFTVQVANYRDKWLPAGDPLDGVKEAVQQYLERSRTDEVASASLPSDQEGDSAFLDISYLDMLRLISVDFHLARMLGLGHIDGQGQDLEDRQFLYLAEYRTPPSPEAARQPIHHLAMSLPTGQRDHRLPAVPVLRSLTYGLTVDNGTLNPTGLTRPGGVRSFRGRALRQSPQRAAGGRAAGGGFLRGPGTVLLG